MSISMSDSDPAEFTIGDVRKLSAVIEALVDYVEAREWSGPVMTLCYADGRREQCGHQCTGCSSLEVESEHKENCAWLAIMRAAGRR